MLPPTFNAVSFDFDGELLDSESTTNSVLSQILFEMVSENCPDQFIRIMSDRTLKDQRDPVVAQTGFLIDEPQAKR